jgi:hypothetical protein
LQEIVNKTVEAVVNLMDISSIDLVLDSPEQSSNTVSGRASSTPRKLNNQERQNVNLFNLMGSQEAAAPYARQMQSPML